MKHKQQTFVGLIFFIFLIPFIIAQEAKINIEHTGYGETSRAARFSIYNTGDVELTNMNVSVDGMLYKTIIGSVGPGVGLRTTLYLDPGDHIIEILTPEDAYDSINLTISSAKERAEIPTEGVNEKLRDNIIWVIIGVLIIIFVIVTWILLRKTKPKLEMEQSQLSQPY